VEQNPCNKPAKDTGEKKLQYCWIWK